MMKSALILAVYLLAAVARSAELCEYQNPEMGRMFNTKVKGDATPEDVLPLLNSPDLEAREGAIQVIALKNYKQAIPQLLFAAKDKCPTVRSLAIGTLAKFEARQAIPLARLSLTDSDPGVRSGAARVLGRLKDSKSVDKLIPLLSDSESNVRASAARALGEMRDNKAAEHLIPLLRDPQTGGQAMEALGSLCAPELIPKVESVMKDQLNFSYVQELLTRMRASCKTTSIVDDLNSKDGLVAQAAQVEINKRRDPELIPPLIEVLKTGTIGGRAGAAMCLAWVKTPKAVDALIGNLTHEEDVVVRTAAYALGEIGDARALSALEKVRNHPDKPTRANIETAIQKLNK